MTGISQQQSYEGNPPEEERLADSEAFLEYHKRVQDESAAFWQNNVAEVSQLINRRELAAAERAALRLMEVAESFDRDDKRLGLTLELLGQIYYLRAEYHYGAPVLMRLLQLYRRCLGADHLDTGTVTFNAAVLYNAWKKYNEAGIFYQQAMFIKSAKLGYEHPDVVVIRDCYGKYLREISQLRGTITQERPAYTPLAREKLSDTMGDSAGSNEQWLRRSGQFDALPDELLDGK